MTVRHAALATALLAGLIVPIAWASPAGAGENPRSLCAPAPDTVAPTATKVVFGRPSIDLDTGSRTQTVRVSTIDTSGDGAASGVAGVRVWIGGPNFGAGPKLTRTSGTPAAGDWTGQFTVSTYARPGSYSITNLTVYDAARNDQTYDGYGSTPNGPNSLTLHPADDPTFTVTGTPATPPKAIKAGTLSALTISPSHVDTTRAARAVRVTARFTGSQPTRVSAQLSTDYATGRTRWLYLSGALHAAHGVWSGVVQVPRFAGDQLLDAALSAQFSAGHSPGYRSYRSADLHHLHFPSTASVTSGVDHSLPRLTSVSLSPDPIDSTNGDQRVTVTARATDAGSGVRSIDISTGIYGGINGAAAGLYPRAASGIGYLANNNFYVRLRHQGNGTWVGTTTVRQCVPSGTYKLQAQLSDNAGNYRSYSTGQLAKAQLTSTVQVTSRHGDVAAPYVYSAATYAADSEIFLNFSEGVRNVTTSTLRVYPLTSASTRYRTPATISAIRCSNGKATIDCGGGDGLVTSAVLTVPDLAAGTTYDVYANLDQVTTQLTDGNRNPMEWDYSAAEVIGS